MIINIIIDITGMPVKYSLTKSNCFPLLFVAFCYFMSTWALSQNAILPRSCQKFEIRR